MAYDPQAPRVTHQAGDADGCKGNWPCSKCGKVIETLPFRPREGGENTLKCVKCFQEGRQQQFGR